ncbi:MAG: acetate--CoA ligase family protein, partial [Peptococcaceae bacterium]|nr:acetate--CoA ligase family protein [Peptococcaceae bacterium]
MLTADEYKKLTDPESVALVGVTSRTGKGSNNPLEVMLEWGYQGKIYPINPKGGSILGYPAYTTLMDAPEIPDIAVICAPRDAVPELFQQCCLKKVKLVIIVAQGFFDGDATGVAMQKDLLKNATEHGVRILGPNTLGVVNNFNRFCTSFMRFLNPLSATGILCQSGVLVVGAPQLTTGIGLLIDTGNTTDLEFYELLEYMVQDSRLKVINMHIESLRNGTAFMEASKEATKEKPIIVYKTGSSPSGSRFASSHTGALAGEYKIFETAFKQCRIFNVQDVEELMDLNKIFTTFDGIKGNRLGVVSISGGAGIIALDACAKYGLEIAELSPTTKEKVGGMYPPWAKLNNPADIWPAGIFHGYPNAYRLIMESFMEDPNIDSVLCLVGSFLDKEGDFLRFADILHEMAERYPDKPIVSWSYGERFQDYAEELESKNNCLFFYSVERAVRALAALYRYHHEIKGKDFPIPEIRQITQSTKLAGHKAGNLSQTDVFSLMESYNLPLARWAKAANAEEAVAAADRIGYPVAMKVLSQEIIHKTDSGGVQLNILNKQQLESAYADMIAKAAAAYPSAVIEGVIIQEYVT